MVVALIWLPCNQWNKRKSKVNKHNKGDRGGGDIEANKLAFDSDDQSSNPKLKISFSAKIFKMKTTKIITHLHWYFNLFEFILVHIINSFIFTFLPLMFGPRTSSGLTTSPFSRTTWRPCFSWPNCGPGLRPAWVAFSTLSVPGRSGSWIMYPKDGILWKMAPAATVWPDGSVLSNILQILKTFKILFQT